MRPAAPRETIAPTQAQGMDVNHEHSSIEQLLEERARLQAQQQQLREQALHLAGEARAWVEDPTVLARTRSRELHAAYLQTYEQYMRLRHEVQQIVDELERRATARHARS